MIKFFMHFMVMKKYLSVAHKNLLGRFSWMMLDFFNIRNIFRPSRGWLNCQMLLFMFKYFFIYKALGSVTKL